jgi:hypothetical protein
MQINNYKCSHCDQFVGWPTHSVGTNCWTRRPRAEPQAVLQARRSALSSAQFGSTHHLSSWISASELNEVSIDTQLTNSVLTRVNLQHHPYIALCLARPSLQLPAEVLTTIKWPLLRAGDLSGAWHYISTALFVAKFKREKVKWPKGQLKLYFMTEFKTEIMSSSSSSSSSSS